jgi:hypothetical protein
VSKIALIRLDSDEIVQVFDGIPASVQLPGVGSVSPVAVGWMGGGELTYARTEDGKETAQEGPPRFALVEVAEADPAPEGKRVVDRSHRIVKGAVIETVTLEDMPAAPSEPTVMEKLQRATGLTVDEIKAALATK